MRAAVGLLVGAAVLASGAWTAALPPPPIEDRGLPASVLTGGPFPRDVVDPLGRRTTIQAPPERIVSLALADDEILLSLVHPTRLAGVTYLVDDPASTPAAGLAPSTAARVTEEDPEHLLALRPDLAVTAGYTRGEAIATLEGAGVPVIGTGAHASLGDVVQAVRIVGRAVGESDRAEAVVRSLEARIAAVRDRPRRGKKARVLVWEDGFTYGAGTIVDDIVRLAGGVDVATDAGLGGAVALTEEAAVALAPDVVVVPIEPREVRRHAPDLLGEAPIWRAVPAVLRGEVHGVPRCWIGSVSLPAVRGLEAMAEILDGPSPSPGRAPDLDSRVR